MLFAEQIWRIACRWMSTVLMVMSRWIMIRQAVSEVLDWGFTRLVDSVEIEFKG